MLVVHNSHLKRLLAKVVFEGLLVRYTLGLRLVGLSWTPGMSRMGRVAGGVFYHPAYWAELILLLEKSLADILPVAEAYLTEYRAPWRLSPGKRWHYRSERRKQGNYLPQVEEQSHTKYIAA
jgi:hypothetical protein